MEVMAGAKRQGGSNLSDSLGQGGRIGRGRSRLDPDRTVKHPSCQIEISESGFWEMRDHWSFWSEGCKTRGCVDVEGKPFLFFLVSISSWTNLESRNTLDPFVAHLKTPKGKRDAFSLMDNLGNRAACSWVSSSFLLSRDSPTEHTYSCTLHSVFCRRSSTWWSLCPDVPVTEWAGLPNSKWSISKPAWLQTAALPTEESICNNTDILIPPVWRLCFSGN